MRQHWDPRPYDTFRSRGCEPFYTTNDSWTSDMVERVAAQQRRSSTESSALIVGTGGLPYILGFLRTKQIIQVDLEPKVLEFTAQRLGRLADSANWDEFIDSDLDNVGHIPNGFDQVLAENHKLEAAGVFNSGTFAAAQQAAAEVEVVAIPGDMMRTSAYIAGLLRDQDRQLSLAHMSNMANYIRNDRNDNGYPVVADALEAIPRANNFMVLSSSYASSYAGPSVESMPMQFGNLESYWRQQL